MRHADPHPRRPVPRRVVALVVLGVVAVALAVGLVRLAGTSGSDGTPYDVAGAGRAVAAPVSDRGSGEVAALAVLRAWDAERGRAYETGSVRALRALYVTGSEAGAADVRVLRRYLDRGLRVEGLRMQVLDVAVLARSPTTWRLRVTDRVDRAEAVRGSDRWRLPRDAASTRTVELRRVGDRWRVRSVR